MKILTVRQTCVVIRLSELADSSLPLLEQARPFIMLTPYVVLDVDGIHFTSMLLGEVVNLYMAFSNHWKSSRHGMGMVNVAEVSQQVFRTAKLTDRIPIFDNIEMAMKALPAIAQPKAGATG
jgi:hypothetical protein